MTTPDDTLLSAFRERESAIEKWLAQPEQFWFNWKEILAPNVNSSPILIVKLLSDMAKAQREAYCQSVCPDCANRIPEPTRIGNVWIHAAGSFTESECCTSSIRSAPWAVIEDGGKGKV